MHTANKKVTNEPNNNNITQIINDNTTQIINNSMWVKLHWISCKLHILEPAHSK